MAALKGVVLLVEDSSAQRAILRGCLRDAGYQVLEAASAAAAEASLARFPTDAILLAWELPDAEGPELLRRWKSNPDFESIPVLMLTTHTEPERIYMALECGAADYLRKPPEEIELRARLRSAVRLKRMHDELRSLASRDSLTGLLNRRAFMSIIGRELTRSRRYGRHLALAMLDVDHFKSINDQSGHDMGDLVLTQLSGYLTQRVREVDVVARFGGEEFVLLLPETPLDMAHSVVDRLRHGTMHERWGNAANQLSLTFSAGVASFDPSRASEAEVVIKRADQALYLAKQRGRNRVEVALPVEE